MPQHVPPSADDRRDAARHACLSAAKALQVTPRRQINCIIKDISDTGCRLVGVDVDTLRSPFLLCASDWAVPRRCDVRWRSRKTIGVRFIPAATE